MWTGWDSWGEACPCEDLTVARKDGVGWNGRAELAICSVPTAPSGVPVVPPEPGKKPCFLCSRSGKKGGSPGSEGAGQLVSSPCSARGYCHVGMEEQQPGGYLLPTSKERGRAN